MSLLDQIKSDTRYLKEIRRLGQENETDVAFFEGRIAQYRRALLGEPSARYAPPPAPVGETPHEFSPSDDDWLRCSVCGQQTH